MILHKVVANEDAFPSESHSFAWQGGSSHRWSLQAEWCWNPTHDIELERSLGCFSACWWCGHTPSSPLSSANCPSHEILKPILQPSPSASKHVSQPCHDSNERHGQSGCPQFQRCPTQTWRYHESSCPGQFGTVEEHPRAPTSQVELDVLDRRLACKSRQVASRLWGENLNSPPQVPCRPIQMLWLRHTATGAVKPEKWGPWSTNRSATNDKSAHNLSCCFLLAPKACGSRSMFTWLPLDQLAMKECSEWFCPCSCQKVHNIQVYIHIYIQIYNITRLGLVGLANVSCNGLPASAAPSSPQPLRAAAKALKAKGLLNHQGRLKLPKPQGAATRLLRNCLSLNRF